MQITSNTPKVSAIIPCLNEERTIASCIRKAQESFVQLGINGEVVVGDNGSSDRSVAIAQELGAKVAHQPLRGYGAAVRAAIEVAEGEYVIMADGDDSYDWSNLKPFVDKLDQGYEFVIGNRFKGKIMPGAMPFWNQYVGNPVLSRISGFLYNVNVRDFHCGMRAFTKKAYLKMKLQTEGMEYATEMVIRSAQEKLKITEVPVNLYPDGRDRKSHLRPFRDGWRHLRYVATFAPDYLYFVPGALLLAFGILLQGVLVNGPVQMGIVYLGSHFLALGLLLTLLGANIITQGVIAKVVLLDQTHLEDNLLMHLVQSSFTLERGLLAGLFLFASGLFIDGKLLWTWLFASQSMEDSIHLAFVGSGLIILGINIIFSSFLLGMFLARK